MINFCKGCGEWFTHCEGDEYCNACLKVLRAEEQKEKERRMSINEQLKYFREWMDKNPSKIRELRNSVTVAQTIHQRNICEPKCECKLHANRYKGILGHS